MPCTFAQFLACRGQSLQNRRRRLWGVPFPAKAVPGSAKLLLSRGKLARVVSLLPVILRIGADRCSARCRDAAQQELRPPGRALWRKVKAIGWQPLRPASAESAVQSELSRNVPLFGQQTENGGRIDLGGAESD
ncbi:MAG: hypothetical protein ACKO2P_11970 [Planctomycetota bacterium]